MKVRVASAGTGKTTSLVLRYLELIAAGTPLRRIAGVTFTRKAADELRQRVASAVHRLLLEARYLNFELGEQRPAFEEARRELDGATLTTIHGFMIEALRLVAPLMGLDPDFSVLGEWEAAAIFEEEAKTVLYLANDPAHGLHAAQALLGDEAEALLLHLFGRRSLVERFEADEQPVSRALEQLFAAAYKRFEVRLGSSRLAPGEVERRALKLARTPQALTRLSTRYHLVLVDEFQDVNPLQGHFFEALEHRGLSIEVVGDPKQSIYGFRNADVEVFRRALKGGEPLPPLDCTYRHAKVITRFLGSLTETLTAEGVFGPEEAPPVHLASETAPTGRLELHWVAGEAPLPELRKQEAQILAERLAALHDEGYAYSDMAVLARAYGGLAVAEEALLAAELPYVLVQGRDYFKRLEIRDLYHALRVGIEPAGLSLAVWLRSPFAQLALHEVDAVLTSEAPLERLKAAHPDVWRRLERIRQQVRGPPMDTLKFLIREPFIGGRRYVDFLATRARENVDALLFTVAAEPAGDIEILLERLELFYRQTDAGDVPQSGEGIALLTVHRAKGLEWPVVGVFDLGRKGVHHPQPLYLTPAGCIATGGSAGFEAARDALKAREEAESYRLLYVAVSRPREVLLLTGSAKKGKADGWVKALEAMKLGPGTKSYRRPDFVLQTHPYQPPPSSPQHPAPEPRLEPAPWIDRRFKLQPYPPVFSPSRFKESQGEPLPLADPDEGERLPGKARAIGTLVHYAISQNWRAQRRTLENLRAQEVMFPFNDAGEQNEILNEVEVLLSNYWSLLGNNLTALDERDEDYPELPMALPQGSTVWQGVIDRLYRVGETWVLEDYKTDHNIVPERYHFQLGIYLQAIQQVRGVTPEVRLVFLREKSIVKLSEAVLQNALAEAIA